MCRSLMNFDEKDTTPMGPREKGTMTKNFTVTTEDGLVRG